jgi:tetratricopeptide (TPR) repeat protein
MSTPSPVSAGKKSALFWSGLVVATLLLCGLTYAVIRYMLRPASVEVAANIPPAPAEPEPTPPTPAVDPTREAIDRHLAEARAAIDSRDYATALRDHLAPVLELDPANQEALELKRLAEEATAVVPVPKPAVPKPVEPKEVETPGIPRRAGEAWPDYTARVARVQVNFQEGNRSLERQDFALAIARFQLVERDQRGFQGVDALITETAAKQKRLLEEAIDNGNRNEQAGKIADAVRWYQQAQRLDANSTVAHDKIASLSERLTKEGLEAFTRAEVFRKRNDYPKAIEFYKQAANLLPGGHEKNREAKQWLEKLTP